MIKKILSKFKRQEDKKLRRIDFIIIGLAVLGFFLCTYLWYLHIQSQLPYCPTGGCSVALTSTWATFLGQPVAAWGAAFYLGVISVSCMRLLDNRKNWNVIMMLLLGIGMIFTFYLRVVEITILHDFCIWCWGSVFIVLAITTLNFSYTSKFRKKSV